MNEVQPIRDPEMLERCYQIAQEHDRQRGKREACWELILLIGFNTSLRVSDFRRFRVSDLRGRDRAIIRAKKTGKEARVLISPRVRREINRLLAGRKPDEYIFQSRQKNAVTHQYEPLTRQRVYQIINTVARQAGIQERIGCHTLRKTFGYHYYQKTGDVVSLQRILCHSFQRETLVYIGVVEDDINKSLLDCARVGKKRATKRTEDTDHDGD